MKSYHVTCPKCNNNHSFYRYGKDNGGYQKYLCRNRHHQFAPERSKAEEANCRRKYSTYPVCGKSSFLHNDYENYSNYRCNGKKCNHSFLEWKSAAITAPSMSSPFGKHNRSHEMRQITLPIFQSLLYTFLPSISPFLSHNPALSNRCCASSLQA